MRKPHQMDSFTVREERQKLLTQLEEVGVHLHLYPGLSGAWRIVFVETPLCTTFRCFKMKLRGFRKHVG